MSDSGEPEVSSAPDQKENIEEASPPADTVPEAPKDQNETVTNDPPSQQPEEASDETVPAPTNEDTAQPAVEAPEAQIAPAPEIPTVEAPADATPAAEQLSEAPVEAPLEAPSVETPVEAPAEPPQTAPLAESQAEEPSSKKLTVTATKETPAAEPETLPTSMVTHVVSQPQNESTDPVPSQDAAPQEATVEEAAPVILAAEAASEALKKAAEKGPVGMKKSTIIRAEGAPDVDGSSNTLFILDLMRQQREKLMRKKKDEMINEMALKMKRQKEDAKRKGATTYSYSYGGFLGVEKLTKSGPGGPGVSPKPSPRVQRKALVIDEVVAVPSDAKSRAMFEGP